MLDDATILSLNCDISKARYCNRTLVVETIISRRRLYRINSDNRSTKKLRVEFNYLPVRYVLLTRYNYDAYVRIYSKVPSRLIRLTVELHFLMCK